jgi:hypothetical protein
MDHGVRTLAGQFYTIPSSRGASAITKDPDR